MIMNLASIKPLEGRKIVITRAQGQQGETSRRFIELGAITYELPALVIGEPSSWNKLDLALSNLDQFDWIIFSSANGVRSVEERLQKMGRSINTSNLRVASVGRKTSHSLNSIGKKVDYFPPEFVAESLVDNFPISLNGLKILLPRVESGGRTFLAESLVNKGAKVVEVPAYESTCPNSIPANTLKVFEESHVDFLLFTSGKTVYHTSKLMCKYFGEEWKSLLLRVKLISIGPQTTLSCMEHFNRVTREAEPHDVDGLIDACIQENK